MYPALMAAPRPVDIVNIFRRIEAKSGIMDDAVATGARAISMQLGLKHAVAADKAPRAGLRVVQSRCIKEHQKLNQTRHQG